MTRDSEVEAWMQAGERRQRRWAVAGAITLGVAAVLGLAIWYFVTTNHVEVGDDRARHAIESAGLHSAILGGADALACEQAESSRHFSALNALGKRVEGTVCCGLTGLARSCVLRWGR